MSQKVNCWEYRNCGMEPGGIFADIYGTCPVPKMMKFDGTNGGRGAGRLCWMVMTNPSTVTTGGPFICRSNRLSCCQCEFFRRVHNEEEITVGDKVLETSSDDSLAVI